MTSLKSLVSLVKNPLNVDITGSENIACLSTIARFWCVMKGQKEKENSKTPNMIRFVQYLASVGNDVTDFTALDGTEFEAEVGKVKRNFLSHIALYVKRRRIIHDSCGPDHANIHIDSWEVEMHRAPSKSGSSAAPTVSGMKRKSVDLTPSPEKLKMRRKESVDSDDDKDVLVGSDNEDELDRNMKQARLVINKHKDPVVEEVGAMSLERRPMLIKEARVERFAVPASSASSLVCAVKQSTPDDVTNKLLRFKLQLECLKLAREQKVEPISDVVRGLKFI